MFVNFFPVIQVSFKFLMVFCIFKNNLGMAPLDRRRRRSVTSLLIWLNFFGNLLGLGFCFDSHSDQEDVQLFDWPDLERDVNRILENYCDQEIVGSGAASCSNRTDEDG